MPRAADLDHDPTMHLLIVGLAHAVIATGELLSSFKDFEVKRRN